MGAFEAKWGLVGPSHEPKVPPNRAVAPARAPKAPRATCKAHPDSYGRRSYIPGSDGHEPRFLTGGPGAAPGGVASKYGWVYMRVQGGLNFL